VLISRVIQTAGLPPSASLTSARKVVFVVLVRSVSAAGSVGAGAGEPLGCASFWE